MHDLHLRAFGGPDDDGADGNTNRKPVNRTFARADHLGINGGRRRRY